MDHISRISTRVEFAGSTGTIRYSGKLLHDPGTSKIDPDDIWLGIEWDDPARGNHNGKVKDVEYFKCANGNKAGSLIKLAKVEPSHDIIEAYVRKYFKNDSADEILQNKDQLMSFLIALSNRGESKKTEIGVEYDDEALIKTSLAYKKIEFLGFDRIWQIMTNVRKLEHLSLTEARIDRIGQPGQINTLFKSLIELSVETNLFNSWEGVGQLAFELPFLESLWLNKNKLRFDEDIEVDKRAFADRFHPNLSANIVSPPRELGCFKNLKLVTLSDMRLNFKTLSRVSNMFPNIRELVISNNDCNDFDALVLPPGIFANLKRLDLSNNNIADSSQILSLSSLKLEQLNLAFNKLASIPNGDHFTHLTHLNISNNLISTIDFFKAVSTYPNLTSIRMLENPILQFYQKVHIRLILIAVMLKLKNLNGNEIKRDERRDAEIYFLKNAFHEFFSESRSTQFTYDYERFLDFAGARYPLIDFYLKRLGNPYPVEERYYQSTINPLARGGKDVFDGEANSKFAVLRFFKRDDDQEVVLVKKKMPKSIDVGYVKTFIRNILKLKKQAFLLYVVEDGVEKILDSDLVKIEELSEDGRVNIRLEI